MVLDFRCHSLHMSTEVKVQRFWKCVKSFVSILSSFNWHRCSFCIYFLSLCHFPFSRFVLRLKVISFLEKKQNKKKTQHWVFCSESTLNNLINASFAHCAIQLCRVKIPHSSHIGSALDVWLNHSGSKCKKKKNVKNCNWIRMPLFHQTETLLNITRARLLFLIYAKRIVHYH